MIAPHNKSKFINPNIQLLYTVAIYEYNNKHNNFNHPPPTIYINASWIIPSCTVEGPVGYLIRLKSVLVTFGF
jgi:hypothetical protein